MTLAVSAAAVVLWVIARIDGGWVMAHLTASVDGIGHGELWRLVTGPLVHTTFGHLARDVTSFTILGLVCESTLHRRLGAILLAALIVPTAAALFLDPDLGVYYGLSGAVYALLPVMVYVTCRRPEGPNRWVLALAALAFVKLAIETVTGRLTTPIELGTGIRPVLSAHVVGFLLGVACLWRVSIRAHEASLGVDRGDHRAHRRRPLG